jgi:hypothetical protein
VTNALTVQSVNGPAVTVIDGSNTVSCAYLTDGTVLSGFTVTHGYGYSQGSGVSFASSLDPSGYPLPQSAQVINCLVNGNYTIHSGGGIFQGIVSNSVISYNLCLADTGGGALSCVIYNSTLSYNHGSASSAFPAGGAAFSNLKGCLIFSNVPNGVGASALNNCLVISNQGSGAVFCYLTNCTVCGNSAYGVNSGRFGANSLINNSIVYYNNSVYGNFYYLTTMNNSCSTPLPYYGSGNITNTPLFVNMAAGDFHLASNSPCINAGNNSFVAGTTDYDGNPRIIGGTVDIGAYEFQSPSSILSYAWAQLYNLTTDGSADFTDSDADGLNNWQEWIAGTNPTNTSSVLKMYFPSNTLLGLKVSWQSVSGKIYFLQRTADLAAQSGFSTLQNNLYGQTGTTAYTDITASNGGPYFYRVGLQQ